MNRALADEIYSDLRLTEDGTYIAWCRLGWHSACPGDALNFGNGVTVQIDGPAQIGGGTLGKCFAALVVGVLILIAAGAMGWGKGG